MRRNRWPAVIALELAGCIAVGLAGYLLYAASNSTRVPTQMVLLAVTPAAAATESAYVTLAPILGPTPTGPGLQVNDPTAMPLPDSYTVVEGDTLWGIAVRFNLDIETLIAANPHLNPDLLIPGDTIALAARAPAPAEPATAMAANARVSESGGGLRLRQGPGLSQPIITLLEAGTALNIVGRTEDRGWLQVTTQAWGGGWVMARYVDVFVGLDSVAVTGQIAAVPTSVGAGSVPLATPPGEAVAYPYITNVTDHARQIFQAGLSLGNRADVFSKVGDSITLSNAFLNPIGYGDYNLREYGNLQPVIDFYSRTIARDANSFANTTLAARVGWPAQAVLSPQAADLNYCAEGEAPLVCEYRWVRPSVALIMLGTNDVPGTSAGRFERHMREVIEISMEMGVVPVVSTLPPLHRTGTEGRVELLNGVITGLAYEYDIPLWDYWSALQGLPDDGLIHDGVHPSVGPSAADFTPENLQYGMAVRNLTALQALDAVWRYLLR